jgi:membrane associated rhomboid family serine protease
MGSLGTATIVVLLLNLALSYSAFREASLFSRFTLRVGDLNSGQLYRLLSSGFIHVDWSHLFFNMFSLYIFAAKVEQPLGWFWFIVIYLLSLLGGSLLAWFYHKDAPNYRAVGASGAVSGIIFAAIILNPGMELSLLFVPFFFPAWIYGLLFILYSIYGIGKQHDNIGHEAHLGGAVTGLLAILILEPSVMETSTLTIIYLLVPSLSFLIVLFFKPQLVNGAMASAQDLFTKDDHYRNEKAAKDIELNRILEKISAQGKNALTEEEQRFLQEQA